ncbi:MAG TPA: sigma-54 dependent transcriptional regulator, partial [bacterium]|nr:sigma-54 dependent transcriptional regulator [bacterium]
TIEVIIFTAFADTATAVDALRLGAYDYLYKPINLEHLAACLDHVAEIQRLRRDNRVLGRQFDEAVSMAAADARRELQQLRAERAGDSQQNPLIGESPALAHIREQALALHRDRNIAVLIAGETGTGKELIARLVHHGGRTGTAPFIAINCAALPAAVFESELFGYEAGAFTGGLPTGAKGKLDLARGGTLFLDEIGELSAPLQAKLLRVLEQREYYRVGGLTKEKADIRFIAATNIAIEEKVAAGEFRQDLLYRLGMARLTLPPLRERREDILPLAAHFLAEFSRARGRHFHSFSPKAQEKLLAYSWPGNVRELRSSIELATLLHHGETMGPDCIMLAGTNSPAIIDANGKPFALPEREFPLAAFTSNIIRQAYRRHNYNKAETAKYLGISRQALYRQLEKLDPPEE